MASPHSETNRHGIVGIEPQSLLAPIFRVDAGKHPPTREGMLSVIKERVRDPRVVAAFEKIDRADFVPQELKYYAYSNNGGLQIREGLVLSQPSMVARMTEALCLNDDKRVLEIGTGTGYGAAILSQLAEHVDTVEIDGTQVDKIGWDLKYLGIDNVDVHVGDGFEGLPQSAPFDAILVTGSVDMIPEAWFEQLVDGGRLVYPLEDDAHGQRLISLTSRSSGSSFEDLGSVNFGALVRNPAA